MSKPLTFVDELPADALAASHKVATLAEVLVDGAVERQITEAVDGTVTLDATAASRGRLDLTIAGIPELIPTAPDSLLAPYGNELRVARGIEFPDRIELVRLGIYRIDNSSGTDEGEGATVQVAGLDRSAAVIDASFESAGQIGAGTDAADAILFIVGSVLPGVASDFSASTAPLPLLSFEEGDDRWAFCQGLATAIGGELYFDRDGILVLRPIPVASAAAEVAALEEGAGGILLSAERAWDRAPVYNRVVVTGENTSGDDTAPIPRGEATDDNPLSPTYYYGRFGRKPYFWPSSYITADVQAADAARGILQRTIGAPDSINFGSIVDPARSPSDVVRITRDSLGVRESHILDSVTIPLAAENAMSGTTRVTTIET